MNQLWFPLLVLAISLASTVFLWHLLDRGRIDRAEQLFQRQAETIVSRIVKRLHDHEQVLLGGNALFHVMGDAVTRSDWRHYVSALNLGKNHPGILGVGFSIWLSPEQKEAHVQAVRAEGFPEYVIRPEGERPVYTSIVWLEPFTWRNQRAFGYDMYSEPVRREAMTSARDTGRTTIAARVTLVQETEKDQQSGMLIYVPSYRQAMPTDTPEERRAALRGFVYSPIRMNDFVRSTLGNLPSDIDFEIYAGELRTDDSLMFSSRLAEKRTLPEGYRPAFSSVEVVEDYGIVWQFTFSTRPPFDKELNQGKSLATLFTGILASILLSVLAFLQARSRRQALIIADQMAQQLAVQQRLALHIEQTPLAAIEWDEHLRVTAWNRAAEEIFGYAGEEAIGTHASFLSPQAEEGERRPPFLSTKTRSVTGRNITKSGKIIECDWYNTQLVNHSGLAIGVASLARDITERLQAEAQIRDTMERLTHATEAAEVAQREAEQASRAKSDFLSTMSHEIRTPMTVFIGAIEQLQYLDKDPAHQRLLDLADQASKRLHALVNDILDFSKIEARRVDLEESRFSLSACLQEIVAMMRPSAQDKGLRLHLEVPPPVPEEIVGDPIRLGQVLINLIGNAIKFTEEGEVKVAVRQQDGTLEFTVSDTGIGIPADKLERIFETFSQVDNSSTRRYGGTGLGLAISKGLVELMGGRIHVRSRLGQGSVFTFTIPMRPVEGLGSPLPGGGQQPSTTEVAEAHILLVEDNPMIRDMVLMTLSRQPWQTTIAETGREAVRKWREGHFDLILMDLQMPDMDGLEATREIRRLEAGEKRICILGLTAHADRAIRQECIDAGMSEVLVKPFAAESLFAAIGRCLGG